MAGSARTLVLVRAVLRAVLASAALAAAVSSATAGCSQSCCTVDSYPIPLERAPLGAPPSPTSADGGFPAAPDGGALLAVAGLPMTAPGVTFPMVIDTGSPFTLLAGPSSGITQTSQASFNLYGADLSPLPLRATFRGWDVFRFPLQPVGDAASLPGGVLGADLLRNYSVEFRFGELCAPGGSALCSSMTFWSHLAEDASLLEDAGYAVVNFTPFGGGEVTADGDPDFLGLRGPLTVPATRVVLRACALPDPFTPVAGSPRLSIAGCNTAQDVLTQKSGVDLSLMIDTGVGPLVLAASAWQRVVAAGLVSQPAPVALPAAPPALGVEPPLYVASWPEPIDVVLWTSIPRYALVNLEIGTNDDPGPCVELSRARRTEIVSYTTLTDPARDLCGARCDLDPNNTGVAQNSAAYLEISGSIPVAVISDDEPFLQGLRFDIQPEGPELDGLVGAAALGRARLELDYLSSSPRAVFSCETDAPRDICWAAARCPQLPDHSTVHYCFDLPAHGLPPACAAPGVGVPTPDAGADAGAAAADGGTQIP
ncbi:MAG TPA: hypothetical protein VI456_04565 [Polyangia bacterium]